MRKIGLKLKQQKWGRMWRKKTKKKTEYMRRRDRWIGNGGKKRRGMKSSNKRKGGKCQWILRKSSQWCNWDMKRTRRVRKKEKKREGKKKRKRGRNSGKVRVTDDEFKWSQANEWRKLNWNNQNEEEFEETDMTDEEICKIGKNDRWIRNAGDNSRGMKSRNKRKWG